MSEFRPMKKDYSKIILGTLALLFGLLAFFYGAKYYQSEKTSDTYLAEKKEINTEYDELVREFEVLSNELELLETSNTDLHEQLATQKEDLEARKTEVSRILRKEQLTREELEKARAMIEELRKDKQELMARIDELNNENIALKAENQTFSRQITTVSEEKKVLEVKNDSLTEQTQTLETENTQLVEEREANADKVAFAQVVPVRNIVAEGVKFKNSGREKTTSNYKHVDKLAITFTVEENPVADEGNKEYLVRVINPDGTIVFDPHRGSGEFIDSSSNEGMKYTTKTVIDYSNQEKHVSLFWLQDRPFQRGDYVVEVYQAGYKVGESTFELRGGLL